MVYKKTVCKVFFIILMVGGSVAVLAEDTDLCNPSVTLDVQEASLSQLIINLAEKHQFDTGFPVVLDKKITIKESASLEDILRLLTRGMSTIIRKQYRVACKGEAITELYFLPTGQETEYINASIANPNPSIASPKKIVDYIHIDDMEQYVQEVMNGTRRQNKRQMTPEQKKEFQIIKKKFRKNNRDEEE